MTTTAYDVIVQALKKAGVTGVGNAPDAEDASDALADLNDMLAEWNTQRWMIWNLVSLGKVSDGRTTPYTIGPGGDFDVARRPDRLESAFLRQLVSPPQGLNVDTPLQIIPSLEEYTMLSTKSLQSFTLYAFLDSSWPLGNIYLYPWPNASLYSIYLQLKNVLPVLDLATDLSTLPDHYVSAMKYNLALRVRQAYGKGTNPDPTLINLARNTLDIVKNSNSQIPELVMPRTLIMMSSPYNIFSDQFGSGTN